MAHILAQMAAKKAMGAIGGGMAAPFRPPPPKSNAPLIAMVLLVIIAGIATWFLYIKPNKLDADATEIAKAAAKLADDAGMYTASGDAAYAAAYDSYIDGSTEEEAMAAGAEAADAKEAEVEDEAEDATQLTDEEAAAMAASIQASAAAEAATSNTTTDDTTTDDTTTDDTTTTVTRNNVRQWFKAHYPKWTEDIKDCYVAVRQEKCDNADGEHLLYFGEDGYKCFDKADVDSDVWPRAVGSDATMVKAPKKVKGAKTDSTACATTTDAGIPGVFCRAQWCI